MGDRARSNCSRKVGGRAVVPLSVGSWVPIERNVTWVEAYLRIKWYPGAFSRLATIHMGRKVGGGAVHLSGGELGLRLR